MDSLSLFAEWEEDDADTDEQVRKAVPQQPLPRPFLLQGLQ
jgi:hypothetical protein